MAASPPQVRLNSAPSSRIDSVIKSSLRVIKTGGRRRKGELLPPQVLPGTFAANENKRMNAGSRQARLSATAAKSRGAANTGFGATRQR